MTENTRPEATTGALVVLSTIGSAAEAHRIAEILVEEGLVACVNLVPGLTSIYRWKGRVQMDEELLLVMKTTAHRFGDLERRFGELHPYDVPELLALPVARGLEAYLNWVGESVETS